MAFYTVEKRTRKDGVTRYRCTVAIKEKGIYIHRESNTFPKQTIAKAWGAHRVAELEANGIPKDEDSITLGGLIRRYLDAKDIKKGRDKTYKLNGMLQSDLASRRVTDIKMMHYIEYARARRASVAGSTVLAEFSYLKTVFDAARPFFGVSVDFTEFESARKYMSKVGITSRSNKRIRRIDGNEISLITDELNKRTARSRGGIPYAAIFEFAIFSCMRVGEVCGLLWSDVDESSHSILVRDRKDPRKKQGNHMVVPLLGRSWDILKEQSKKDERIFPYSSKTVSCLFFKVKSELGIEGLRFHDTRREGASRLFELGMSIEEVAQVTGHKNLNTLWTVYREIYPQTLHDRFDALQRARKKDA